MTSRPVAATAAAAFILAAALSSDASFTCPCCGIASHNPNDVEQGYCGRCHWWTGDPLLGPPHLAEECEVRP